MKKYTILLASLAIVLHSCKDEEKASPTYQVIELSTDFGNIYLTLYDSTPLHKHNFDSLVNEKYYDSTEFHRCVDDFVIQGGSPTSKDDNRNNDGSGGPGYTIPAEIDSAKFKHFYGALAAARTSNPERRSSGSQFYIVTNVNGAHFLDGEYTTFGKVIGGMDVAKTIEKQPKNTNSGLPNERIKMYIRHIEITQEEADNLGISLL